MTQNGCPICETLKEICLVTGDPFLKPPNRIERRWLSALSCSDTVLLMFESLKILYFTFIPNDSEDDKFSRNMYQEEWDNLLGGKNVERREGSFQGKLK